MPIYIFTQNNSGGSFDFDEKSGITHYVFIEAKDYKDANERAQNIGIYFNGCDEGLDCECCGDRWYELYNESEFNKVDNLYKYTCCTKWMEKGKEACFHKLDGTFEFFDPPVE